MISKMIYKIMMPYANLVLFVKVVSFVAQNRNRYSYKLPEAFNPRPHMLFSHPRTHMGGGGCNPPPCHFAPN